LVVEAQAELLTTVTTVLDQVLLVPQLAAAAVVLLAIIPTGVAGVQAAVLGAAGVLLVLDPKDLTGEQLHLTDGIPAAVVVRAKTDKTLLVQQAVRAAMV
jgi:hypothetical protein